MTITKRLHNKPLEKYSNFHKNSTFLFEILEFFLKDTSSRDVCANNNKKNYDLNIKERKQLSGV